MEIASLSLMAMEQYVPTASAELTIVLYDQEPPALVAYFRSVVVES